MNEIKSIITLICILALSAGLYFGFKEIVRLQSSEVMYKQTQAVLIKNVETITASVESQKIEIANLQQKYNNIRQATVVLSKKMEANTLVTMGQKDPEELRKYINQALEELFKEGV